MSRVLSIFFLAVLLSSGCASRVPEAKKPIHIFGNDGTTWIRPQCPYQILGKARADTELGADGRIGARGDNRLNFIHPSDRVDPDEDPLLYLKNMLQDKARRMGGDALIKLVEMKEMGTGRTIALTCEVIRFTDENCQEDLTGTTPTTPIQSK
jgi:hypothetical protein